MKASLIKAFTIMELIVVLIIAGVLAGIAIPNFFRSIERARVQDAITQLSTIHAAQAIRFARLGKYWPEDLSTQGVEDTNSNLHLNIIENDMTYSCTGGGGASYSCQAARDGDLYTVTVDQDALSSETGSENPVCTDGTDGTCP